MTDNVKCGEVAPIRVYWPGADPMFMCVDHATAAKKIALAMGAHVPMEPVGGIHTCEHSAKP